MKEEKVYVVRRTSIPVKIDADPSKNSWKNIRSAEPVNLMGQPPAFVPEVTAKMMYDDDNLYVIFQVNDRFVKCVTSEINGPVWEDSCVEFFFAPIIALPERYFNLEMNCGGTPLMHYNLVPREKIIPLDPADIREIEIAHTMPRVTDPEIPGPVTWCNEYRIPLNMLRKYSNVTSPAPGVEWRANFYKCAENNSNPHFITWNRVDHPVPDFHRPEFFGKIRFA